jgi:hypothetical protein
MEIQEATRNEPDDFVSGSIFLLCVLFHILGGHRVHSLQYPPVHRFTYMYQRHHYSPFCISFHVITLSLMYP